MDREYRISQIMADESVPHSQFLSLSGQGIQGLLALAATLSMKASRP